MSTLVTVPAGLNRESPAPKVHSSKPDPLNLCASQARLIGSLLILLSAFAMITPFLLRGPSCGADFLFHYTSWHDAARSWHNGIFYPHWTASANFRAGEPRFVFYPPAVWMLGAALGSVLPWHAVPIALCFLLLAATGFATRAFARLFLAEAPAALAGCTAIFSGYAFYEVYHHGDFALLSGGLWIPLALLLFFKQPRSESLSHAVLSTNTVLLALVVAGSWLSNTPLGLMVLYLLTVMALASAIQTRSWTPLARVATALALGLALASFYIVPAAVEQHWVDIRQLFASPDHQVQHRWLTSDLHIPHERKRGLIEIIMLGMAFAGLAVTRFTRRYPASRQARRQWMLLAIIPAAILFLMLPVSLPVWNIVPRLRYLQYPWRWLIVLQAPMAIFFASAVSPLRRKLRPLAYSACGLLFLAAVCGVSHSKSMFRPGSAANSGPYSLSAMDRALGPAGAGVGGAEEYTTQPGAHNELIAAGMPDACLVSNPAAPLSAVSAPDPTAFYTPLAWSPAASLCSQTIGAQPGVTNPEHLRFHAEVAHPGYMVLRLRTYPAWKLTLNGRTVHDLSPRPDGLIALPVPQGPLTLSVDWTSTPDVAAARLLTALGALLALGLWSLARLRTHAAA